MTVDAAELVRRFEASGGLCWHYRGERSIYASTFPQGRSRLRFGIGLCPSTQLYDSDVEVSSMAAAIEADERLFARAENELPTVPLIAALATHLQIIDAPTLESDEEKYDAVRDWLMLIEACGTLEAPEARRVRASDAQIRRLIAKVPGPALVPAAPQRRRRVP